MTLAALLAERQRRAAQATVIASDGERYAAIAATLRAWHYQEQSAFFRSPAKRKATSKTRRAGVTSGGCHEFLARAFEQPAWRGMYCNEVREEAKRLAWRADTKQGMVDLLEAMAAEGKLVIGQDRRDFAKGADVKIDEQALTIEFRHGAQIRIFAADDAKSQERARGGAPHVCWIDEAQKFPFLQTFVDSIIGPSMTDYDGEIWLTGTPSEWCTGYFFDVTQEEVDKRVKGWEVHTLLVTMNPFYGKTAEERWARTAGAELERNNWTIEDPPASFRREWLAQWVKTDARFVYWVHRAPQESLEYAPLRVTAILPEFLGKLDPEGKDPGGVSGYIDRWYDHTLSMRDLPKLYPGTATKIPWRFALGTDFGYNPHPFATTLWAFCDGLPDLWEMWSWKRTLVIPEYQKDCLLWYWREVPGIDYLVGDPGGQAGANMEGWRQLTDLPIQDADKFSKATWQELLNNAIVQGLVHFREGSPMLHEMKHLTWTQRGQKLVEADDRKLTDGTIPGNDACFVAGTMVETELGPVGIERVRAGDRVWTRDGVRDVLASASTGVEQTYVLRTASGRRITGTANHPVWTEDGWMPLASLTPGITLLAWGNSDLPKSSSTRESGTAATRRQSSETIACTTRRSEVGPCTEPSTRMRAVRFLWGIMSTIAMAILSITTLRISKRSPRRSTCASTVRHRSALPLRSEALSEPGMLLGHGTHRPLGGPGTLSTERPSRPRGLRSAIAAWCATLASKPSRPGPGSVAGSAASRTGETGASTTRTAPASSAAQPSASTATPRPVVVRDRVLDVCASGRAERVYNLTVGGVPEYFANGILVHNCDAGLYAARWIITNRPATPPPLLVANTPEWYAAEEAKMARAADEATERLKVEQLNWDGY